MFFVGLLGVHMYCCPGPKPEEAHWVISQNIGGIAVPARNMI